MKRQIVLASGNTGKLAELQQGLAQGAFSIQPYAMPDVDETGLTFIENALIKARFAATETRLPVIADDSGLVVPLLQGAPGIYSARFAGTPQDAAANIRKLLSLLETAPEEKRTAWFHCSIVYLEHEKDPAPFICEGRWQGRILREPRGKNGFGYDPVFLDPVSGKSAAELSPAAKQRISHRGKALRQIIRHLNTFSPCPKQTHGTG